MGTLAALALALTLPLSSSDAPPSHEEIMSHGARLVDAPASVLAPEPVYETDDQEIICPPPTKLRCWIATAQEADAGAPGTIYCSCRK